MKKLAFLTFAMFLAFTSCSDKDSCEAADWAGTYSGSFDCLDTPQTVIIDITEGSDNNTVNISIDGDSDQVELDGCSIEIVEDDAFGEATLTLTLDGDNLNYNLSGKLFEIPFECEAVLTK